MNSRQQIEARHRKFQFTWQEYISRDCSLENYEFDKYTIVKKIGSGSFATVYLAKVNPTQQKVAIKVISLKSINEVKIQRLKQIKLRLAHSQSRIMMHFSSQHIIRCYETFQSQDFKFMILQYCDGGDLAQKVQKQIKLQEDEAISMMRQIVNGLSQCHSKGIIHRDLKLDNIMLHNGVCKLADFGFSKILSINPQNQNQTCMNTTLGTPTTMAPQVKNFQPYGLKADIWSIGVIFFNMLFGKCPFESKQNFNKVMLRISGVLDKQEFYEGVKIGEKVRKFLKQVLVVDPKERLGWRGLISHEIFQQQVQQQQKLEKEEESEQLFSSVTLRSSCFLRRVSFNIDEQKMTKLQTDININPNQNKQQTSEQNKEEIYENESQREIDNILKSLKYCDDMINDEIQNQKQQQGDFIKNNENETKKQDVLIKPCKSEFIDDPAPIPQQQQILLYNWSRHAYLQCQKTQVIYNKIILPIETHKLLDFTQRKSIQFMYLLCTRCYNNMAPIFYVYQSNKNSQVLQQLTQMIQRLHSIVQKKWNRYSYLLTEKENEKIEIAADWTKRAILSRLFPQTYDYQKREKFMTGIESVKDYYKLSLEVYQGVQQKMSHRNHQHKENDKKQQSKCGIKDYTREQQIQYTIQYFNTTKDKFLKRQSQQCKEVILHLNKFQVICSLSLQELKHMPFKKYVEQFLIKDMNRSMKKK